MLSQRSSYVHLSPEEVAALSPIRHLDRVACPVIVAYGSLETPEFQRQAREWAEALRGTGRLAELIFRPELNHFEMPEDFARPGSAAGRALVKLMGLGR
jgi:arylformamidase